MQRSLFYTYQKRLIYTLNRATKTEIHISERLESTDGFEWKQSYPAISVVKFLQAYAAAGLCFSTDHFSYFLLLLVEEGYFFYCFMFFMITIKNIKFFMLRTLCKSQHKVESFMFSLNFFSLHRSSIWSDVIFSCGSLLENLS